MKRMKMCFLAMLLLAMTACGTEQESAKKPEKVKMEIELSDEQILADGNAVGTDTKQSVYVAKDIVYYESGKDFTYGEGTEKDAHSAEEAAAHTVVHITEPGEYRLSGKLTRGQIAVDLGDGAKEDPDAVVTLILDNVDITCEVAPAIIFYEVYECGSDDAEQATKDVDTSSAGANVIIADGSTNTVHGSYVEKIYKPDSIVLNEDKTEVEDAKKLHKYDGAFYSRMSMNISGEEENTGVLDIFAENEGLDTEMHLTINGGNVNIQSGNDGINTNEDGVSVTTVNGGSLTIHVSGETGEGDGIDSNGWLVINGGTVNAYACSSSADAGIDSDMGIHINGGTVIATGHMLDQIEEGGQTYAVFSFAQEQGGNEVVSMKNESGNAIMESSPLNAYSILVYSSAELKEGVYTMWLGDDQLAGSSGGMMMGGPGMQGMPGGQGFPGDQMPGGQEFSGGEMPEGFPGGQMPGGQGFQGGQRPEGFSGGQMPGGQEFPGGQMPGGQGLPEGQMPEGFEGMQPPEGELPEGMNPDSFEGFELPEGSNGNWGELDGADVSVEFSIKEGANTFSQVNVYETTEVQSVVFLRIREFII